MPIEYAYDCINNARIVLTGRYHASIVAQQTSTPFVVKLKQTDSGYTYSYNKVYGSLENLFKGQIFDEFKYMRTDWKSIFDYVVESLDDIVLYQMSLYDNKKTIQNRKEMYRKRLNFINENVKELY